MPKYIFLDTNVFLHYKPVNQLQLERFGKGCILVVPRVILGELNKHKDSHSSNKIRSRARSVCKDIHFWSDSGSVSDVLGFNFYIKTSYPENHCLDPNSNDDRFLSDILEYPAPPEDKLLISNDSNLCLTAKHLGIEVEMIDDKYALPQEADPIEKENQALRRELELLKNARPRLKVGVIAEESQLDVDNNPLFPVHENSELLSDEDIESKVAEIRGSLDKHHLSHSNSSTSMALAALHYISPEEISEYHRKLSKYPEEYRKYLIARREFLRNPIFIFSVGIANVGTAPADNVDIYLYFPDGFELFEENDVPQGPAEPPLPSKPLSSLEKMTSQTASSFWPDINRYVSNIDTLSSFSLKKTNSYEVSDSFRSIKHNERVCLHQLFLRFDSFESIHPFCCKYRVTVDNLPQVIEGGINFQFQKGQ